jgi:hypothetical protein
MTSEAETPWALYQRLRAEGHSVAVIHERLRALGLDDADIKTLTLEAPPAATGLELPGAAKIAAVLVAGPLLGGALIAATGESIAEREPPPPQVPLADDDPSQRCARHPRLASAGTCPSCGTFVCRDCAGESLELGCASCIANPKNRAARLGRARTIAALAVGAQVLVYVAATLVKYGERETLGELALSLLLRIVPIALLVLTQAFIRSAWPSWVAVVLVGLSVFSFTTKVDGLIAFVSFMALIAQLVTAVFLRSAFNRDRALDATKPTKL